MSTTSETELRAEISWLEARNREVNLQRIEAETAARAKAARITELEREKGCIPLTYGSALGSLALVFGLFALAGVAEASRQEGVPRNGREGPVDESIFAFAVPPNSVAIDRLSDRIGIEDVAISDPKIHGSHKPAAPETRYLVARYPDRATWPSSFRGHWAVESWLLLKFERARNRILTHGKNLLTARDMGVKSHSPSTVSESEDQLFSREWLAFPRPIGDCPPQFGAIDEGKPSAFIVKSFVGGLCRITRCFPSQSRENGGDGGSQKAEAGENYLSNSSSRHRLLSNDVINVTLLSAVGLLIGGIGFGNFLFSGNRRWRWCGLGAGLFGTGFGCGLLIWYFGLLS
jgi:hypothetical protein